MKQENEYDDLIPNWVHFSISELDELRIIKKDMAKKLLVSGVMKPKRIGNKLHVSRKELLKYLLRDD